MKNIKYHITLLLAFLILITCNAISQTSATIDHIWQEHNVVSNSLKGMNIHIKFSINNMQNQTGFVIACFVDKNESDLMDYNKKYRTSDGKVATWNTFTPDYKYTVYNDFVLFMPYEEFHLTGYHELYFYLNIIDSKNQVIAISDYNEFNINWGIPSHTQPTQQIQSFSESPFQENSNSEKTNGTLTEKSVYEKMIALKSKYPNGMSWTNSNTYTANNRTRASGCAGFAYILSDEAFGSLPQRKHTDIEKIKVGDILRMNSDTHSVVVLQIDNNKITIAEGNINSSILWGRTVTWKEAKARGNYVITRYPE